MRKGSDSAHWQLGFIGLMNWEFWLAGDELGGGFKHSLFSSLFGE